MRFSVEARGGQGLQGHTNPKDRKHRSSQAGTIVFRDITISSRERDNGGQLHTEGPREAGIYIGEPGALPAIHSRGKLQYMV